MDRLQKVLARAGLASRRGAEDLIREGRVTVDGETITTPGASVDPTQAKIEVDGRPLRLEVGAVYLLMNKPRGILTSRSDPHHSRTVYDLLPPSLQHLHYVGRLDKDSEGLLLFTNDGELTHQLTHPRHQVAKTYQAEVAGELTSVGLQQLAQGVALEEGMTAPARVRVLQRAPGKSLVEIEIHEGRKRQVRRMFEGIGCRVIRLARTSLGPLSLGGLEAGQHRLLKPSEVQDLKRWTGKIQP